MLEQVLLNKGDHINGKRRYIGRVEPIVRNVVLKRNLVKEKRVERKDRRTKCQLNLETILTTCAF